MANAALILTFVVAAFAYLFPKLWELVGRHPVAFTDLTLYLPAILLGSWAWWRRRSFASAWPVVCCVGLVWIGLAYAGPSQSLRGLLIAALLTIPLPVAALISQQRCWHLCAKTYVLANVAALVLALWFETRVAHGHVASVLGRFGFLPTADGGGRTANPNQVGGQLALAAVLAFILYLSERPQASGAAGGRKKPWQFSLAWTVFLSAGCLLTASRGAFVSWFAGMGLLCVWGTRGQSARQMRDLVAAGAVGLVSVALLMTAGRAMPWDRLESRLTDARSMGTMAGRTQIWRNALTAWKSSPDLIWHGTGTGRADEVLGQFDDHAEEDDYGVLRKNCHNAFVEWGLSFGLLGIVAGTCLGAVVLYRALRLDRRERNVGRLAVLACVVLFAMTAVSYRHPCWMATGSLVLAMLGDPAVRSVPVRRRMTEQTRAESPAAESRPGPRVPRPDLDALARF